MVIVWLQAFKPLMEHVVLRRAQVLLRIPILILDVNHILTNVSLMAQDASNNQLVKQLSLR